MRKWILPNWSNPLLVVRDPVLLLIYFLAYTKGIFPRNAFIAWITGLGALATFVSLATTNTPMIVTMFGLRADYMHLPLIFVLPEILRRADLRLIGIGVLALAGFMAVLVLAQFRASSGSRLNAGAGENTTMLESAFGHVRPSGTFSYTNGLTGFTTLATSFFLQHLLEKRWYPRTIWLASIPALLVLVVLSGSRLAALTMGTLLAAVLFISVVQSRYRTSSFKLAIVVGIGVLLVGSVAFLQSGIDVFTSRFKSNKVERNGLTGRYLGAYVAPFLVIDDADATGAGLGMGTNVAAGLLLGKRKFMFAEGEGGRVVIENGPVIGFTFLGLRLCMVVYIGAQCLRALRLHAATLPLLIFTGCFNDLLIGQFSQATELGYATIAGGLCLTACRAASEPTPISKEEEEPVVEAKVVPPGRAKRLAVTAPVLPPPTMPALAAVVAADTAPVARGRSALAQRLHAGEEGGERGAS